MNKADEILKEMVNPEVYQKVDNGSELYKIAMKIANCIVEAEQAAEQLKNIDKHWEMIININHTTYLRVAKGHVMQDEMKVIVQQTIALIDAIEYAELRDTMKKFNNILKEQNDGQDTSK